MKPIRLLFILLSVLCWISISAAPDGKGVPFNGLILDGQMQPVKKVRVYNTDRNRYATSDKKGRFGLTDVAPDDTITLEIKKEKICIPVNGRTGMRIILGNEVEIYQDDAIVNEGYGYVKRREYTGSSSGFSGEQLRQSGARNLLDALAGKVAGLTINMVDGRRVANLRGLRSINLSNEALYVVDGSIVESLDMVSIYDVDHVEILKNASQYGMRGANGAIIVTTK